MVFGNTRDPLENDARGFHFHCFSRALVNYLIHTLKDAKGPTAIAEHLRIEQKTTVLVIAIQSGENLVFGSDENKFSWLQIQVEGRCGI